MAREERELITILGGSQNPDSMGKACTLADIQTRDKKSFYRLMIDCGAEFRQEPLEGDVETNLSNTSIGPDYSRIGDRRVDAILLTHLHYDHVGSLAHTVDLNYNSVKGKLEISGVLKSGAPIISSPQTAYGLECTLRDGEMSDRNHTVLHTTEILRRRRIVSKPGVCEILPGLPVFFRQVGHLSGAACIAIPTGSGGVGLITGDLCREDMPITKGLELPSESCWPTEWVPDQIWSTDLTYGVGAKPPLSEEVARLQNQAREDLANGKKIVVAAFRTGRGQNLPLWLLPVVKEFNIPIWLDGSISKIYKIFQAHPWSDRDGILPEIGEVNGIIEVRDSRHRVALLEKEGPAIFVTTSGMGNFGPVVQYIRHGSRREDFSFYFTSWLAGGSNGEKLLYYYRKAVRRKESGYRKTTRARIMDPRYGEIRLPLRADVHHFRLGAHGDLNDFVALVRDFVEKCRKGRPLKRIILTHGNFQSLNEGAKVLQPFTEELYYGNSGTVVQI